MPVRNFYNLIIILGIIILGTTAFAQNNIEKYIKMLGSQNKAEREKAASLLEKEGSEIIPALKNIFGSEETTLRQKQYAMNILGKIADKSILPFLKEQFDKQKENVVKVACLQAISKYLPEKLASDTIISGISNPDSEVALIAVQIAYLKKVYTAFPALLKNLETEKKIAQIKIISALAASSMYAATNVTDDLRKKFTESLKKNIEIFEADTEMKYQLIFAFGYSGHEDSIPYLIQIIKEQKFVKDVQAKIDKLNDEFMKTEETLKDKIEELEKAKAELQEKISALQNGVAERQIRVNDTTATILAKYHGIKAFDKFIELLRGEKTSEIEETFYVYAINCSSNLLTEIIKAFAEKAPDKFKDEGDDSAKKIEEFLVNFDKYINILKKAFVRHLFAKPESFKTIKLLTIHYADSIVAERLLDSLAKISTPEIIETIASAFDKNSNVKNEIKIIILDKFRLIVGDEFSDTDVSNYNRELVLNLMIKPVLTALNDEDLNVASAALRIIKVNSFLFASNQKDITEQIQRILKDSDESIISLACEVLVKIEPGKSVKTMLDILDNIKNVESRTKIMAAFANANFSSAIDITRFLGMVENDLLDTTKDKELRKNAAQAIRRTGDPKAVEMLIKALKNTSENDNMQNIDNLEMKTHLIEQFEELKRAANFAIKQIIVEMNAAYTKYYEIIGKNSDDVSQKLLVNSLISLIRKCLSAIKSIKSPESIEALNDMLYFEDNELNLETLKVLKSLATDPTSADKILKLIMSSIEGYISKGIATTENRVKFTQNALQSIGDLNQFIKGRIKNDVRKFVREILEIDNTKILKEAIKLIGVLKDRRSRRVIGELAEKYPDLKQVVDEALAAMK